MRRESKKRAAELKRLAREAAAKAVKGTGDVSETARKAEDKKWSGGGRPRWSALKRRPASGPRQRKQVPPSARHRTLRKRQSKKQRPRKKQSVRHRKLKPQGAMGILCGQAQGKRGQ